MPHRLCASFAFLVCFSALSLMACEAREAPTPAPTPTLVPSPTPTSIPSPTPLPSGLYVDAARTLGAISRFARGVNHGPWAFLNPEVTLPFNASGINFMRFPGGDWGDQNEVEPWHVDLFMSLARQVGAEPLISARLRGGTPEKAVALWQYTRSKNYHVRYWSIGNEPSLYAPQDARWNTEYFNVEWRKFAQALKAADPNILLVGPDTHQFTGEPSVDPKDAQGRDWLREFLKANGDLVDVVAVHRYPFPKQRGEGPPSREALFNDPPHWDTLVTNLRKVVKESAGRDLPIAITEFNASWVGTIGGDTTLDSFNNALWLGDVLGRLMRQRVDIVAYFTLVSGGQIGGFGLFDRFDPRPSYYTYLMYKNFGDELVFAQSDTPKLSLYAARTKDTLSLMLINLSDQAMTRPLTLEHFDFSADAQITLFDATHNAEPQPKFVLKNGAPYTAPPFSMTHIRITGKVTSSMQPKTPTIPAAAWSRGIGVPYEKAGHSRVSYPLIDDGVWGGLPLGGLGAGAIGRTYRGDFARWHLDIGKHVFQPLPVNQFSVFVQQGNTKHAHVLAPLRPDILKAWNWDMPVGAGTYHALFPKAWFTYEWDALPVRLTQKQFSPVIPHNYQESSYPVGVFEWTLENPTDAPMTVGLMFTWQNLLGRFWDGRDVQGGNYNFAANQNGFTGIVLARPFDKPTREWDSTFAIATTQQAGMTISYRTRFLLSDGAELWQDFASDGKLDNVNDTKPAEAWEVLAAGLAVTVELAPHETRTIPFTLAWDMPITEFGAGTQWYKRYTKFYGTSGRAAWQIAIDALQHYHEWEAAIDAWQQPILDDTSRPDWYKTALFNELYYLVDGGTLWENGRSDGGRETGDGGVGRFAFLECYDYPFYNTFDVNFYSSFALALLWPELEKSIIRDFAATVPQSDPTIVTIEWSKQRAPRKLAGALPHDLGGPREDPFLRVNHYNFQDINRWKDLNSKFVLQVWRDVVMFNDHALAHDTWHAVVQALDYLRQFDTDGDDLLDHDGPDQTYDTWPMKGASAYGGSLWLAALEAAIELGKMEGDTQNVERYAAWLERGKQSFEAKLWNGAYYLYDASGGAHSDSIMADQLAGQWYADATGLAPIAPADHIRSALKTVFAYNVKKFGDGDMGAVNGMRPDGAVDTSSEQSQEVWTGTNYALAAFMLHRGLKEEAWVTAHGVYNVTYQRGYWFRTPEAYDIDNNFRPTLYMRPLSVWAMEHALKRR